MINWGILGAGNIAHRFLQGLSYSEEGQLYAVASHSQEKRDEFKRLCPQIITYDNYDDILNDKNIDAVYLAMWHKDHYQWAKQALLKHKAVLCEKPAVLSTEEMKELAKIAKENQVFFMEAMKTRFIPMVLELKKILDEGTIGKIQRVENRFCYDISQAQNTRYLFEKDQGGILNDVGSYNIASLLDYINENIVKVENDVTIDRDVDVHDRVTVTFEHGQIGFMEMAMDENKAPLMTIYGTKGKIECIPFYRPEKATVFLNDGESYEVEKGYTHDDFYTQIAEVHQCLKNNQIESKRMRLEDSIKVQELTEQIREKVKEKKNEI